MAMQKITPLMSPSAGPHDPFSHAVSPVELLAAGAGACARAVQAGRVSALELCDAAIARIEELDGAINAVVVRDFARARVQARAVDAAQARGERLALMGVPMTVKSPSTLPGCPPPGACRRFASSGPTRTRSWCSA
jgi:amidase